MSNSPILPNKIYSASLKKLMSHNPHLNPYDPTMHLLSKSKRLQRSYQQREQYKYRKYLDGSMRRYRYLIDRIIQEHIKVENIPIVNDRIRKKHDYRNYRIYGILPIVDVYQETVTGGTYKPAKSFKRFETEPIGRENAMVVVTGNGTTTVRDKTKVNKNDMSKSHLIKQYRVSETGLSLVQKELMRQIEKRKEGHVSVVEEDKEVEEW